LSELLRGADDAPADELNSVVLATLRSLNARGAVLYLIDYEQAQLQPAPGGRTVDGAPRPQPIDETSAGEAFSTGRQRERPTDDGYLLWTPITQRSDLIGVLEVEFETLNDGLRELCIELGLALGHLLTTAQKYTDAFELLRRRHDMNLAAEMHWDMLPAMCYSAPGASLTGGIEPAYEVGGDAFDYSINDQVLDVAMFDAMGHGLDAALLSSQAVSAYRFGRRRKLSLSQIAQTIEDTLIHQFGGEKLVTAVLCELNCVTGALRWVNMGHLAPLRLHSFRLRHELESPPDCPLGLGCLEKAESFEVRLQPGDQVLIYSDGVVEARSPEGEFFELERLIHLIESSSRDVPGGKMVQHVINHVKAHTNGPLRDDATLVMIEYEG
jgi:serine phosphatase RsbU (regulator of sigma subunit)